MADLDSNAEEIEKAIKELDLPSNRFRRLRPDDAERVYLAALRQFVIDGSPRWWWEHFPSSTSRHFAKGDGFSQLVNLVPDPDEPVWFVAEDFVAPEFSVWEATPRDIQAVLGECYHFEYYLIQQQFRWLICENHHDLLIAVGKEVEERLNNCQGA